MSGEAIHIDAKPNDDLDGPGNNLLNDFRQYMSHAPSAEYPTFYDILSGITLDKAKDVLTVSLASPVQGESASTVDIPLENLRTNEMGALRVRFNKTNQQDPNNPPFISTLAKAVEAWYRMPERNFDAQVLPGLILSELTSRLMGPEDTVDKVWLDEVRKQLGQMRAFIIATSLVSGLAAYLRDRKH